MWFLHRSLDPGNSMRRSLHSAFHQRCCRINKTQFCSTQVLNDKRQGHHHVFMSTVTTATNNNHFVDLRSDTVTSPTREMLSQAISAKTGDDVLGEDPTVIELQQYSADMFGKQAALFLPSGTMSNLVALMAHCDSRASEIIVGSQSHICLWEGGNVSGLAGIHSKQLVEDPTGRLLPADVLDTFRDDSDDHFASTQVLCLENSHNMMGGAALPKSYIDEMGKLCRDLAIELHIDGARVCNAAVSLDVPVAELCAEADSVSVCLSKGLGAPLGTVLVGSTDFIRLAKRARKRCGGGMRQAGVVAAMGLYALKNHYDILHHDHVRAQRLAHALRDAGFRLLNDDGNVDTNIVYFALPENCQVAVPDFCRRLASEHGVKLSGGYNRGGEMFRCVTHHNINDSDIVRAIDAMTKIADS